MTDTISLNTFDGIKGYATYKRAFEKLAKEVPNDFIQCFVAASPEGRFIPVAVGERAVQAGLHFRGIVCVG